METMNNEMKEAEKHITGMEKWCGLCVCPWNRFDRIQTNIYTLSRLVQCCELDMEQTENGQPNLVF